MPVGHGATKYRKSITVQEFTPLHKLMQLWAPAYYLRATTVPLFLHTREQLHSALPPEVVAWLAKLVEQPEYLAGLPYWAQVAVAQLMLAPPVQVFKGETIPPAWLPEGCLAHTTAHLPHLTQLPLDW
jgi:hypothetical protein